MEITSDSTYKTEEFAVFIANLIKSGDVLCLEGELGTGKTTFVSFLAKSLGYEGRVQSPTFVLHRTYNIKNPTNPDITTINHMDLYRFESEITPQDFDLESLFSQAKAVTAIEWPDRLPKQIFDKAKKLKFETIDESTKKISAYEL